MAESEEAVRKFLGGEIEAFSRIVHHWERRIYNLAWRMLNNREDAQDIVQETFLSVFKSIRSLRAPGSFSTWLYQIALNHCRARRRSRKFDVSLEDDPTDQAEDKNHLLPVAGYEGKTHDKLETIDLIQKALAGLGDDQRTAIILKEYMGLSLEEVAEVMECPLSTAKSRLYNGIREVQGNLTRMGFRIED
jgi:RNA polymerase sigma-70 factor (ECF subfamily)